MAGAGIRPEPEQARASAPATPPGARMGKHSLVIAGHRTSISLEEAFWRALREIADRRGSSLAGLVAEIDATRGAANLSSAIRVFILGARD